MKENLNNRRVKMKKYYNYLKYILEHKKNVFILDLYTWGFIVSGAVFLSVAATPFLGVGWFLLMVLAKYLSY